MQTVTRRDRLSTAPVTLVTKETAISVSLSTGNKSSSLLLNSSEMLLKTFKLNSPLPFRCVAETNGGCSDFASCKFVGPVSKTFLSLFPFFDQEE